jgi:hypothetical protein
MLENHALEDVSDRFAQVDAVLHLLVHVLPLDDLDRWDRLAK